MTTQVFRGKTLLDARNQATRALGHGAVILTSREVKRAGFGGILGGVDVEIAAATSAPSRDATAVLSRAPFAPSAYSSHPPVRATSDTALDGLTALRAEVRSEMRAMKLALAKSATSAHLSAELLAIRETLAELAPPARADKAGKLVSARGIEGGAATVIARAMRARPEGEAPVDRFRAALTGLLPIAAWPIAPAGRSLIAAVGPAGVGKTTTIAKLATIARMGKKTVTLVTCDTFRVGGVEQIKRYASLLDVRHEVARDAKALAAVLSSSDSDVILVDTSGRPLQADAAEGVLTPERLATIDRADGFTRSVLLCMPASIRWVDAVRTTRVFASVKPGSVVVTKTDETDAPAGVLHAVVASGLPLSILCTGPRVPEDIEAATPRGAVERVLGVGPKGEVR